MQSSAPEPFRIHDRAIAPGSAEILTIPVSQQVTGLDASLALKVLHGAKPGPAVFVSAAIHGDEIVGTAIIQRLLDHLMPGAMAGTLILAPGTCPTAAISTAASRVTRTAASPPNWRILSLNR